MASQNPSIEQQQLQLSNQIEQLKAERFQHHINQARWSAIPAELQDGTEPAAIEAALKATKVIDAQLAALTAMLPTGGRVTEAVKRRARRGSSGP